jgi:hypothetical protein
MGVTMAASMATAFGGCSSDSGTTTPDAAPTGGFTQPAGTVAVNFSVDDSANKVYAQGDLVWKGNMLFDATTRKITVDATGWDMKMWAALYDDGPWDQGTPAGHEPKGSTAGDHKWGVTVFITPPATGTTNAEYGLIDNTYEDAFGNGWIWLGMNGTFTVAAGATAPINAAGLTIPKFGTTDLQLTIDLTAVDAGMFDTSAVGIKGSGWAWGVQTLTIANNKAVFTLSSVIGAGKPFSHTGLFNAGDKPEFNFVFGTGATPKEYKDGDGNALMTGVTAAIKKATDTAFSPVDVVVYTRPAGNGNTYVTIP